MKMLTLWVYACVWDCYLANGRLVVLQMGGAEWGPGSMPLL